MIRTRWMVLVAVCSATLPAAAQRSGPIPASPKTAYVQLPDPPQAVSREAKTLRSNMQRLARYTSTACPSKLESLDDQLRRMASTLQGLGDATDKAAFSAYYDKTLLAHIKGHTSGVPGYGTYAELDKLRTDGLAALEKTTPKPTGMSEKEIRAFSNDAYHYNEAAKKQHAFATEVMSKGLCPVPSYDKWAAYTSPSEVGPRLIKLRDQIMPKLDVTTAEKILEADAKATYTRLLDLGTVVRDSASAYIAMTKEADKVKVLEIWTTVLGGESQKQIKALIAKRAELLDKIAALYARRIKEVAPPPEVKASSGLAKKLIKGAIAIRGTSEIRHVDQEQSDTITKNGKEYLRKWREVFDTFDVYYVTKAKPYEWMTDIPGVPVAKVCTLWVAGAFKYSKGLNVKLGAWHSAEENVMAPMLCERTSASFAP